MGAARPAVPPGSLAALLRPGDAAGADGPFRRPEDVGGRAAWDVLVRDGLLVVARGDAAAAPGAVSAPADRANLLVGTVPAGAVVAGRTAAWVHAGATAGDGGALDLTYPARGHRPARWGAGLVWQSPLLRDDLTSLAGLRVTTPVRTVVDLALRFGPDEAVSRIRVLVDVAAADLDEATWLLERRVRAVGRPRARDTLARARRALGAPPCPLS